MIKLSDISQKHKGILHDAMKTYAKDFEKDVKCLFSNFQEQLFTREAKERKRQKDEFIRKCLENHGFVFDNTEDFVLFVKNHCTIGSQESNAHFVEFIDNVIVFYDTPNEVTCGQMIRRVRYDDYKVTDTLYFVYL